MKYRKSAFPIMADGFRLDGDATGIECMDSGMSLRDYFAGQAIIGLALNIKEHNPEAFTVVARHSYEMADAMLAERERSEKQEGAKK
jgi:hypothetical protein